MTNEQVDQIVNAIESLDKTETCDVTNQTIADSLGRIALSLQYIVDNMENKNKVII